MTSRGANFTVSLPSDFGSWLFNVLLGGAVFKGFEFLLRSSLGLLGNFDMVVIRYPEPHGFRRTRKHVSGLTTIDEMRNPNSPLSRLDPKEEFFVEIPPKDTTGQFEVIVFYKRRFWSLGITRFPKGYRLQASL